MQRNISTFPQLEAIRAAASDRNGKLTFYEFPPLYSEYNTLAQDQFEAASWRKGINPKAVEVPAYAMDELMNEREFHAHFIKADVEGAEAQVVAGLKEWLNSSSSRWLALEYLAAERHNESHRKAAALLNWQGWKAFSIQTNGTLEACNNIEAHLASQGLDSDNIVFMKA